MTEDVSEADLYAATPEDYTGVKAADEPVTNDQFGKR